MWLRLALNIALFLLISACSPSDKAAVDKLNSLSYAFHYRDIDSTEVYANRSYELAESYPDGRAEALNNKAFVQIVKMNYHQAEAFLDEIPTLTDNQLELLVCYVQQMRLCQRRSNNREFYDWRERAMAAIRRINEERAQLSERQRLRLLYAESELAIVTSTYYYYIGLERQSIEAIEQMPAVVKQDTAQFLNYLYNIGAGGIIKEGSAQSICQQEFDYLVRCIQIASRCNYPYFYANALEALAEHLIDDENRTLLIENNAPGIRLIRPDSVSDEELPIFLAENALGIFLDYGDVYQIAGANRTLASCFLAKGDPLSTLYYLNEALADSSIQQAPDLVASIREQMSVAYAAINDKEQSDYNRNLYLDLQEKTRQDRSLEARAGQLDATVAQQNILLIAVAVALLAMLVMLRVMYVVHRRRQKMLTPLDELKEQREELEEQLAMVRMKQQESERRNLELRATISLANSITPLIDRMLHAVQHGGVHAEHTEYVKELASQINEHNKVLTHWIQLRQGELNLHVESFALQDLFDLIAKGRRSFQLKGLQLNVIPTDVYVKADRVLTLFMLNTLTDNARKFTDKGGEVKVSAEDNGQYVEIAVADNGCGMDKEALARVFDHKVAGGHGFGLQNCKGIIEKYRKTSQIFSVCKLGAESQSGRGSRFYFRLPKGIVRLLLPLVMSVYASFHANASTIPVSNMALNKASAFADSAYHSNINGTYERTLLFADSCCWQLNSYYRAEHPDATDTLTLYDPVSANYPDLIWLHENVQVNFDILLTLRNESAVAALTLHDWKLYHYNNRIYTLLFRELSADRTLDDYCRKMQQARNDRTVALILLALMGLVILVIIVMQVVQSMGRKAARRLKQQTDLDLMSDEVRMKEMELARLHVSNQVLENCLSALKHETMYYPSRIIQLLENESLDALEEVVVYYRELYGILSEQAERQIEKTKLHLVRLDHEILGDRNLIGFLFEILKKLSHQTALAMNSSVKDDKYVICEVSMPDCQPTDFMPTTDNIPYLICRQIVREHGEATGRRACGIRSEKTADGARIILTLPRYISKQ